MTHHTFNAPFLKRIRLLPNVDKKTYPFNIPAFKHGIDLELKSPITLFVGENGAGKSTLLEGIAYLCNFNLLGGSRNHLIHHTEREPVLADALRLSWLPRVSRGFFVRSETFFHFASYIDELASEDPSILDGYGGKSLHAQSHGEALLTLFKNRLTEGIYILDEPEAALSPKHQLSFLVLLKELLDAGRSQFIIATHSPILLACVGAEVLSFGEEKVKVVNYKETEHYSLTKAFLDCPERFFKHLFDQPKN